MAPPPAPGSDPTRPTSFNEAYAKELHALRPEVFTTVQAAPLASSADDDNLRKDKDEQRAKDLAALFERVGTELKADQSTWDRERAPLAALCLSGGGIRSATFNLGMLQGLARKRLLQQFDYLSSVSGGGFVAGWLKTWMHRDGT